MELEWWIWVYRKWCHGRGCVLEGIGKEDVKSIFLCQNKKIYNFVSVIFVVCICLIIVLFVELCWPQKCGEVFSFCRVWVFWSGELLWAMKDTWEWSKAKGFCYFQWCGSTLDVWGFYIEMHAFAISMCWLYKATLKTWYHCVRFFSPRTVLQQRGSPCTLTSAYTVTEKRGAAMLWLTFGRLILYSPWDGDLQRHAG